MIDSKCFVDLIQTFGIYEIYDQIEEYLDT